MFDNSTPIENVALGQKFIIYAILVNFLSMGLQFAVGEIAGLIGIVAIGLSLIGMFRLASGLGYSMASTVLLVIFMLVPLVNIITLLILSSRATKALRSAGFKVGLLGASIPANA